jgi:nucleoside-diphosphate-sugar epimerase
MGMNWLITGGCGFIGTSLVGSLVSEGGHFIRIIDNLSLGTRENVARVCSYTEFDPHTVSPDSDFPIPDPSPSVQLITLWTSENFFRKEEIVIRRRNNPKHQRI